MKALAAILPTLIVAVAYADEPGKPKERKPNFTISKETTYVTGPVDKEGYIDYAAALNERLGKGVTPETNANVLIWKALGPMPDGNKRMPAEFFKRMGMEEPAEKGEYFVDLIPFMKDQLGVQDPGSLREIQSRMALSTRHPWSAKDNTEVDRWLKANEKSLAVVIEASKRSHYFSPVLPERKENGSAGLLSTLLPGVQKCRGLTNALAARAMREAGEGRDDAAWQDLLACHRLARFLGHCGTLVESLVGLALESTATRADVALLESTKMDSKAIQKWLGELQLLPRLPDLIDAVDLGDRFSFLEFPMLVDGQGIGYFQTFGGGPAKDPDPFIKTALERINWDPALKSFNRWHDRIVDALRERDRGARDKQLEKIENDIKALKRDFNGGEELGKAILDSKQVPETAGRLIGDILIFQMLPAVRKVQQAVDRIEQGASNLQIAFALAAYQRDHKSYPKTLDELAPKYLPKIPDDLFTNKPLTYRPEENGFLLYSFGPNGKDDGGRTLTDDPKGDDIAVRIPNPKPKAK